MIRALLYIALIGVFAVGCANQQLKDFYNSSDVNNSLTGKNVPQDQTASTGMSSGWTELRAEAMAQAANSGRVVLANFTGSDWCHWCKKLETEIFDTPRFKQWAANRAVLLHLDFPKEKQQSPEIRAQNTQLAQIYAEHITGYPTVLFLDASGQILGKLGYVDGGPEAWIRTAEQQLGGVGP